MLLYFTNEWLKEMEKTTDWDAALDNDGRYRPFQKNKKYKTKGTPSVYTILREHLLSTGHL